MPKKYHIYIGSNLEDVKNERKELPRAVMELGHIPVMADYLDPEDENSARLIEKIIGECDYFISLVACRYCRDKEKNSPMETEYRWALKQGVPVLGLIIDDKARRKAGKKEENAAFIRKLKDFKAELRKQPHETWLNAPDLRQKTLDILIRETNLGEQPGWVRATEAVKPALANEIGRLSAENEELKKRIGLESGKLVARLREQMRHDLKVMALNRASLSFYYANGENWENTRKFRYLRIFKLLVPELNLPKTTAEITRFLGGVLNPDLEKTVRKDYPTPSNTIKKIMTDFALLRLFRCDEGAKNGEDERWEITEYGKELYSAYRVRQLERSAEKSVKNTKNTNNLDKI
ncbi:MAG: DUF4062 domain-containing protein [Treponema sp.]|nr:DUF4062 domain-containing protein [Treponema sp.]